MSTLTIPTIINRSWEIIAKELAECKGPSKQLMKLTTELLQALDARDRPKLRKIVEPGLKRLATVAGK